MTALADGQGAFAPAVNVEQQRALGQARRGGVAVNRLRARLGQADEQKCNNGQAPEKTETRTQPRRQTAWAGTPKPAREPRALPKFSQA